MSDMLISVDEVARQLGLHPKTVLRYIHDGRLKATRVGKSYRILRAELEAFAGIANGGTAPEATTARATCIVDIPDMTIGEAERLATFLGAIALTGGADSPQLQVTTAFDPKGRTMKVVLIGEPADVGRLLEMMPLRLGNRA